MIIAWSSVQNYAVVCNYAVHNFTQEDQTGNKQILWKCFDESKVILQLLNDFPCYRKKTKTCMIPLFLSLLVTYTTLFDVVLYTCL